MSEEDLFSSSVKLHDAQFAVAIRYGFRSWHHLSDHCVQKHKESVMNEVMQEFNELTEYPDRAIQRILREIDTFELARALNGA